jgi:cyclopropane fatty-acyl-phospholipid synthase-like methyltransferase
VNGNNIRALSSLEAEKLAPGSHHYTAYVGPPDQYDFMGASQFRLLTTLGLRSRHRVLDVGCGSLRAGRFLIMYLAKGHYYGIEPNQWLVHEAIQREIGQSLADLKTPTFSDSIDFDAVQFDVKFDFIVAQSIFSHAGPALVERALSQFAATLVEDGLALVTFIHPRQLPTAPIEAAGWTYPGCTTYQPDRIEALIAGAGMVGTQLPWFHPRQTWYALALRTEALPKQESYRHLTGAVLRDPTLSPSGSVELKA